MPTPPKADRLQVVGAGPQNYKEDDMNRVKIFFLVIVLLASCFGLPRQAAAEDIKIGYIDIASVFDKYDKTKEEDAVLAEKSKKKQDEREAIVSKIKNMKNELELLSEKQRQEKQAQIETEVRKLQDFDREVKGELRGQRDDMVRDILKEIDTVIKDYAKKNAFTIVLNSRVLVYAQEQQDITREILNILNSKYRKKK